MLAQVTPNATRLAVLAAAGSSRRVENPGLRRESLGHNVDRTLAGCYYPSHE